MGAVEVHPSQRRVSCEVCRKHKSRCRRLHANDLRCARCMLLDLECTAGLQNKVGRPRRAVASSDEASKQLPSNPVSTVNTACTTPAVGEHSQVKSPGRPRETSRFPDGGNQLVWSSFTSPVLTQEPVLVTPANNSLDTAPTWPPMGMDFLAQVSLPWDTLIDFDQILSSSDTDSSFGLPVLPSHAFDIPAETSSLPDHNLPPAIGIRLPSMPSRTTGDVTVASHTLFKLSKLNLDLHIRLAAVEENRSTLNFDSFVYENSVLHIDDTTLAEFMLRTSQEFLQTLKQLLCSRSTPSHLRTLQMTDTTFPMLLPRSSLPYHDAPYMSLSSSSSSSFSSDSSDISEPALPALSAPIALTITSSFIQLISLYESTLEHMTARIKRIAIDPVRPIPKLSSGGLPVVEPCVQGMLFAEVVVHLLERIEQLLGIGVARDSGDESLLSARQRDVLWSELGGSIGVLPNHGVTRPANVRNTFKKLAAILKQISLAAA